MPHSRSLSAAPPPAAPAPAPAPAPAAASAALLADVDYVGDVNQNLVCPICFRPFVQPVTSPCDHTFCAECIAKALDSQQPRSPSGSDPDAGSGPRRAHGSCPVDRRPLTASDLTPASIIIANMVSELRVYCPHRAEGCPWTGERHMLASHLGTSCDLAWRPCPLSGCPERLQRSAIAAHVRECAFRTVQCDLCGESVLAAEAEDHRATCPALPVQCPDCAQPMVLEVLAAHHESCPLRTVACDLARFGCTWTGPRASLHRYHTESCAYVAIQGFFVIHERQMAQMALENAELRQTMSMFDAKLDMLAKQFDDLQVSLRDVGPPPMLIDQMSREMQMMKADLANINTLAIQQDVSLMSENTRLREEMQSIRTICQSIQSQLIGLAIEHRKAAASKFSNGVSAAAASAAAAAAAAITGGVASSGSSAASSSQSAPSAAATAAASASAAGAGPGPQRPAPPQGDYQQQFEQRFPRSRTDTGTKL